nr:NUDIX domain-containing protein [Salsipaludibacter albus]
MWRRRGDTVEVLVGHMGGPFWARKDLGAWSFPKGLAEAGDADGLATAEREFTEELGQPPPPADPDVPDLDLGSHRAGGKQIHARARHGDLDPAAATGGTFTMEWPPRSGREQEFPEVDRAEWMPLHEAREALAKNQRIFLDRLADAAT